MPSEEEKSGKRGESLTFTVEVGETTSKDGGDDRVVAVQSGSAQSRHTRRGIAAVDGAPEENGM